MPTRAEVEVMMAGAGGPFEVVREQVRGIDMKVFKDRLHSLREVAVLGRARGDADSYLVYGDQRIGFAAQERAFELHELGQ